MASGDIHYRSPLAPRRAAPRRAGTCAIIARHESWGMIWFTKSKQAILPCRDRAISIMLYHVSRIIWSAWKPNYIFRRRSSIDFQTESRVTLIDKYLAKSWWSNGRESEGRWSLDDPRSPASDGIGWSTITHCTSVNSSSAKTRQNQWRRFTFADRSSSFSSLV